MDHLVGVRRRGELKYGAEVTNNRKQFIQQYINHDMIQCEITHSWNNTGFFLTGPAQKSSKYETGSAQ